PAPGANHPDGYGCRRVSAGRDETRDDTRFPCDAESRALRGAGRPFHFHDGVVGLEHVEYRLDDVNRILVPALWRDGMYFPQWADLLAVRGGKPEFRAIAHGGAGEDLAGILFKAVQGIHVALRKRYGLVDVDGQPRLECRFGETQVVLGVIARQQNSIDARAQLLNILDDRVDQRG